MSRRAAGRTAGLTRWIAMSLVVIALVAMTLSVGFGATFGLAGGAAVMAFGLMWPLLWLASLTRASRSTAPSPVSSVKVSILVPARNEEAVVAAAFDQMLRHSYQSWELLVLADNCTDRTAAVAKAAAAGDVRVRVIEMTFAKGSKAHALNAGLSECCGDVVLELDADNQIGAEYLSGLAAAFANPGVSAVQTQIRASNVSAGLLPALQDMEFLVYSEVFNRGRRALGLSSSIGGTGFAIRRETLEDLGGWDDGLVEDFSLHLKLTRAAVEVEYEPGLTVYDEKPETWAALVRQRKRWIRGHLLEAIRPGNLGRGVLNDAYLLSPLFVLLSGGLLLLGYAYAFAPGLVGTVGYYSPVAWLSILATTAVAVAVTLARVGEWRRVPLVPLYVLVYPFHWLVVMLAALGPVSWERTKTRHGHPADSRLVRILGVEAMASAAIMLTVLLVAAAWGYPLFQSSTMAASSLWTPVHVASASRAYASVSPAAVSGAYIDGNVRDASGAAIAGAAVILRTTDGVDVTSTVSSSEGSFVLGTVAGGAYEVTVSAPGLSPAVVAFYAPSSSHVIIDARLTPTSSGVLPIPIPY